MTVIKITSESQFDQIIKDNTLAIIDFTASWCPPCKAIAPVFEKLSSQYGDDAVFLKVDVDENQSIASRLQIKSMPTFFSFIGGQVHEQFSGADKNRLKSMINNSADIARSRNAALKAKQEMLAKPLSVNDVEGKSIKELKGMMTDRGLSYQGLLEKQDLINSLLQKAA